MWLKHNKLLIIVLTATALPRQSVSSLTKQNLNSDNASSSGTSTPIFETQSHQIGKQCSALPTEPYFKELIEDECYVDKTEYLDKMLSRKRVRFFFLSRPRRFDKTLLIDTMEEFFKGEQDLFKNTEIYQRRPDVWPSYPTIRIDFSGISTDSVSEFKLDLVSLLQDRAHEDNIHLQAQSVERAICELIVLLNKKLNSPVVILSDEYNSPYTSAYSEMRVASGISKVLQRFFKTLKGLSEIIHFCFVTGATRLGFSDIFSSLNSAVDLTMDPKYAGIVGFNEIELHQYFGDLVCILKKFDCSFKEIRHVCSGIGRPTTEITLG